jgi:hypothetical protein
MSEKNAASAGTEEILFKPDLDSEDEVLEQPEEITPEAKPKNSKKKADDEILDDSDEVIMEQQIGEIPVIFRLIKDPGTTPNLTLEDGTPIDEGYPAHYFLPCEDVIVFKQKGHPLNGKNRTIRFIEGETSIFKDEQSEDANFMRVGPLVFTRGYLRVYKSNDPLVLEYLRAMNHNGSNPNGRRRKKVFEELVIGKAEKEEESQIDLQIKAVSKAGEFSNQDLLIYSKYLNYPTIGKTAGQLRTQLKKYAMEKPAAFLKIADDPMFKVKQIFILAQDKRIITWKEVPNALVWISGPKRTPIVNIPAGEDALEFLSEWATLKEGNATFNLIKQKVKEAMKK